MIEYDRSSWWRTCLAIHGTVIPRVLGRVGLLTAFCLLLCILDQFVLSPLDYGLPALDQLGHTVLGIAMGMLIVFRTNSSYTRYWDARTFWGSLINNSRNLMRVAVNHAPPADDLGRYLVSYVRALKQALRGSDDLSELKPLLSGGAYERMTASRSPLPFLTSEMSRWVAQRSKEGTVEPWMALELEQIVDRLVDAQGGCERIQKTPLPFVYVVLIRQLLILYLASLPFVLVAKMQFAAPLVVAVVALGMLGIEEAGVEIENPFGLNANTLPLERFCKTIARDTAAVLEVNAGELQAATGAT